MDINLESTFLHFFRKRKVINLDFRPERHEKFRQRLRDIGCNPDVIERFSAIDGQKLAFAYPERNTKKLLAEKGLFLSYYYIWKEVAEDTTILDNELVIIFEDDVTFSPSFTAQITRYMTEFKEVTKDVDTVLLYIGGRFKCDFDVEPCFKDSMPQVAEHIYYRPNTLMNTWKNVEIAKNIEANKKNFNYDRTTHCIIMDKAMCRRLMMVHDHHSLSYLFPIDHFLEQVNLKFDVPHFYDALPHLVYSPLETESDIQVL